MANIQYLLEGLQSVNPNKRYEACEELRVLPSIPGEAIEALREVTKDINHDVADAAQRALDLHEPDLEPIPIDTLTTEDTLAQDNEIVQMYKSIRSWAIWLVIIGVISIVASGMLDPAWGILLILVGLISWRIKIPAMFVIYSAILAGAAVANGIAAITGSGMYWLVLAVIQVFFTFSIIKNYSKYSKLPLDKLFEEGNWPEDLDPPQNESYITSRFAITSFLLSVLLIVVLACSFSGIFFLALTMGDTYQPSPIIEWIVTGAFDTAWLAIGLGVAALLVENNRKGWAIAGLVIGGLVLIGELGLTFLVI